MKAHREGPLTTNVRMKLPRGGAELLTNYGIPVPGHLVTLPGRVIPDPNGQRTYDPF
jgi:hypothetical protein